MKNLVTMGGGKGHARVLKAIRDIPGVAITAVCASTDSGGSTGVLKEHYDGGGYTGDLTRCVLALCKDEALVRALSYRYDGGPLHTHSVRNLLLHSLEKAVGVEEALQTLWRICGLGTHRVVPVTTEKTELCATLRHGNTLLGEANIDNLAKNPLWSPDLHSIEDVYLKPAVRASSAALEAVERADCIVICPGDLYSSVLPTLLPLGMREALGRSHARIVLILNIMTKRGETDNYTASNFIEEIEKRLGRRADVILCNNAPIPPDILATYSLERKVELEATPGIRDSRIVMCPLAMVADNGKVVSDLRVLRAEIENVVACG